MKELTKVKAFGINIQLSVSLLLKLTIPLLYF